MRSSGGIRRRGDGDGGGSERAGEDKEGDIDPDSLRCCACSSQSELRVDQSDERLEIEAFGVERR